MSELTDRLKSELRDFIPSIGRGVRDRLLEDMDIKIHDERENNIAIATMAMLDAGLSDNTVIEKLQKYWDLRRSETVPFLKWAHEQLEKE